VAAASPIRSLHVCVASRKAPGQLDARLGVGHDLLIYRMTVALPCAGEAPPVAVRPRRSQFFTCPGTAPRANCRNRLQHLAVRLRACCHGMG